MSISSSNEYNEIYNGHTSRGLILETGHQVPVRNSSRRLLPGYTIREHRVPHEESNVQIQRFLPGYSMRRHPVVQESNVGRKTRVPCPLPGSTMNGHTVLQEQGPHVLMRRTTRPGYTKRGHRVMQETRPSQVQIQLPLPGYTTRGHRVRQATNDEVEKLVKEVLRDRITEEV